MSLTWRSLPVNLPTLSGAGLSNLQCANNRARGVADGDTASSTRAIILHALGNALHSGLRWLDDGYQHSHQTTGDDRGLYASGAKGRDKCPAFDEALQFPGDYDGIIAGAPAIMNTTHQAAGHVWDYDAFN